MTLCQQLEDDTGCDLSKRCLERNRIKGWASSGDLASAVLMSVASNHKNLVTAGQSRVNMQQH